MSHWRETTLGALAAEAGGFVRTGPFGSQLHAYEYTDNPDGVPVVMPKDMVNGRVDRSSVSRVESPIADRLSVHRLSPGDVVLARRGDIGRYAFVADDEDGWLCGTGCLRIHAPNHDGVSPSFLRYALGSPEVTNWLVGQAVGATMPNLNASIVANVPLGLPDPKTQRRVGAALSAFDELIAINERRIELLEDLVRALYREWFIRFRAPGTVTVGDGELPSGWNIARLGDVATLNYGKALPAGKRRPGPVAVVSSAGVIDEHDVGLVEGPGVVLGRKGNVGSVWWIDRAFPIDTTYYVDTDMPLCLLYWLSFRTSRGSYLPRPCGR